jgi:iron complex outermembrane receptor protein
MSIFRRLVAVFYFIFVAESAFGDANENASVDLGKITVSRSGSPNVHSYAADRDAIEASPFNSLVQALALEPVDLQSRSPLGGVQTDYSIQGSNFQEVLMLFDGQRINDPQTAHHNSDIPATTEDVEKIEVIPGMTSARFGPDGIGGAIDTVLRRPDADRTVFQGTAGVHASEDTLFSLSRKQKDSGWRLSYEQARSDGFHYYTDFKNWLVTGHMVSGIPDGEFGSYFGYENKEFGAFDFYTPGLGYPSREWTKTYLSTTGLTLDKDGLLIKPNFLWRRHYDQFMLDETGLRSKYLAYHHTDMFTPNIYFQGQAGFLGKLGAGAEYGDERIISTTLGKHGRTHRSVYLDDAKIINDNLSLECSGRLDDYDGFGLAATGSSGFKYKIDDANTLLGGVSRSIRAPSFTELYYIDPTTVGDSGLSEEESLNVQAGYDHKNDPLGWGQIFFLRQERNSIDWVKHASSDALWRAENRDPATVLGIENYAKWHLNDTFSLNMNYTYLERRADDAGLSFKYGPNYVNHLLNNTLQIHLPFGTQTIGMTYKKKPDRGGYAVMNARFCYNLNKNAELFFKIENLFDKSYQEIVGIPQSGQWIEGGIRFQW